MYSYFNESFFQRHKYLEARVINEASKTWEFSFFGPCGWWGDLGFNFSLLPCSNLCCTWQQTFEEEDKLEE